MKKLPYFIEAKDQEFPGRTIIATIELLYVFSCLALLVYTIIP